MIVRAAQRIEQSGPRARINDWQGPPYPSTIGWLCIRIATCPLHSVPLLPPVPRRIPSNGGARAPLRTAPSPTNGRGWSHLPRRTKPKPTPAGARFLAWASAHQGDIGVRQRAPALFPPHLLPRPQRPCQAPSPSSPRGRGRGPDTRGGARGAELLRRRRHRLLRRRAARHGRPCRIAAPSCGAQHEGAIFSYPPLFS